MLIASYGKPTEAVELLPFTLFCLGLVLELKLKIATTAKAITISIKKVETVIFDALGYLNFMSAWLHSQVEEGDTSVNTKGLCYKLEMSVFSSNLKYNMSSNIRKPIRVLI